MLVALAVLVVGAALMLPVFSSYCPPPSRKTNCQLNLKQIGLGFLQYAQDYNERFSPIHPTPSTGWADALYPYIKSQQIFQCISDPNTSSTFTSDYFYNSRLACVPQRAVSDSAFTIISGDGNDNALTWSNRAQLPTDATTNPSSPAQRHLGHGNYGFVDGHAKSFGPNEILNVASKSNPLVPKFAPR